MGRRTENDVLSRQKLLDRSVAECLEAGWLSNLAECGVQSARERSGTDNLKAHIWFTP
jgi:hypothetical protein